MRFFSWLFSVEGMLRVCEITAIVAGALAVAALIGKDVAGRIIADRKSKEIQSLREDVAGARTKQSEAEEKLESLRRRQATSEALRGLSPEFVTALKERRKGHAVVVYVSGSSHDIWLAQSLVGALNKAGWTVPPPTQISSVLEIMPKTLATGDIVIVCPGTYLPPHADGLMQALSKEPYPFRVSVTVSKSHEFPDDRPRIIINPRP